MKNNKCISLCLYGDKIWYYLPFLYNMDVINRSNLDYDFVIRTTQDCKDRLCRMIEQENIIFNNNIQFKLMKRQSVLSRGMFWRYHELLDNEYDHITILDIDARYGYQMWDIMEQFFKSNYKIGTLKTLSCNGSLIDGGLIFFNRKLLDLQFFKKFKKICDYVDNKNIVNYDADQKILQMFLNKYMKSGEFICYNALKNKSWYKYNDPAKIELREKNFKDNYKEIVDLSNYEFRKFVYKGGWYSDDFYKSLKYYDFDKKIYKLDGIDYKFERDYSGSRTDNYMIENLQLVEEVKHLLDT